MGPGCTPGSLMADSPKCSQPLKRPNQYIATTPIARIRAKEAKYWVCRNTHAGGKRRGLSVSRLPFVHFGENAGFGDSG